MLANSIVIDMLKLVTDFVTPAMEVGVRQMLTQSLLHNQDFMTEYYTTNDADPVILSLQLDENFDTCMATRARKESRPRCIQIRHELKYSYSSTWI